MKGHIRQRGEKSFGIGVYLGRDEHGVKRYKWKTVKGSRRTAQRELNKLLAEAQDGNVLPSQKYTVATFIKKWLTDHARDRVDVKTFERYEQICNKNLIPALGRHSLEALRPMHIAAAYSKWLATGRKDGAGGLSAQTVTHHHRLLHLIMKTAVRWQLRPNNPVDAVDPPRIARKEQRAIAELDTAKLLRRIEGSKMHLCALLAITTGLRRGEILGLTWDDIDLDRGSLKVRHAISQTRKAIRTKEPKTSKSRRTMPIPQLTLAGLREARSEQERMQKALGPLYEAGNLVCCHEDGRAWRPDSFTASWARVATAAGFDGLRFQDLRHSHATQLLIAGVHPKIVSERLGHSTVGLTLDRYSHVLPGMQDKAVAGVDRALRKAFRETADCQRIDKSRKSKTRAPKGTRKPL